MSTTEWKGGTAIPKCAEHGTSKEKRPTNTGIPLLLSSTADATTHISKHRRFSSIAALGGCLDRDELLMVMNVDIPHMRCSVFVCRELTKWSRGDISDVVPPSEKVELTFPGVDEHGTSKQKRPTNTGMPKHYPQPRMPRVTSQNTAVSWVKCRHP